MDPFSALSVATAVAQFVDLGTKIIGRAHEIYQSVDGATRENLEVERVTIDLRDITKSLEVAAESDSFLWNDEERKLQQVARGCGRIANELLAILEQLKTNQSRFRSWEALKKAIRTVRKKQQIESLQRSLDKALVDLSMHMHYAILEEQSKQKKGQSSMLTSIREVRNVAEAMRLENAETLRQNKEDLLAAIHISHQSNTAMFKLMHRSIQSTHADQGPLQSFTLADQVRLTQMDIDVLATQMEQPLLSAISKPPEYHTLQPLYTGNDMSEKEDMMLEANTQVAKANLDLLLPALMEMNKKVCAVAKHEAIINSLQFQEMPTRYIQIPVAYPKTNAWMLQQGPFRTWLETSGGVFWINGKAGSGKSTLVKFLADNPVTLELLEKWAGIPEDAEEEERAARLAVVSFYFWKSGYLMQRSLNGLFQCILYHVFKQCPSVIPEVCKGRWMRDNKFHQNPTPWTQGELSTTLDALLQLPRWPSHVCIFIDGLDEYAGTSDEQYRMVGDLDRLAAHPSVKVCVSSRPWNVFRTAYEGNEGRQIVLQEHNRKDLDTYIAGKLEGDARFRRLAAIDNRTEEFAMSIRKRANGVFFWVFLVVRSLLDGLTEDDDIDMLQDRLLALPPSLEDYFQHMLKSIDITYKKYTARALLMACNATRPLPISTFDYLQTEIQRPNYALTAPVTPTTHEMMQRRRDKVRSWINKWCKDLLELSSEWGSAGHTDLAQITCVDFIHRTARDFLIAEDMQLVFAKDAGKDFNVRLSLCRTYLASIKNLTFSAERQQVRSNFLSLAGYVMYHAKECEAVDGTTPIPILQELDRVGVLHYPTLGPLHWTCTCSRYEDFDLLKRESNFLSYAIEFDLQIYVQTILRQHPEAIEKSDGAPLLSYAELPTVQHEVFEESRGSLAAMTRILIEHGAKGNRQIGRGSTRKADTEADLSRATSSIFVESSGLDISPMSGARSDFEDEWMSSESRQACALVSQFGTSAAPSSYLSDIAYGRSTRW